MSSFFLVKKINKKNITSILDHGSTAKFSSTKFSNCIKVLSPGRNVSTESSTSCMLLDLGTYS